MLETLKSAGVFSILQILLFLGSGLWVLVCAVFLGLRRQVPPLITGLPLMALPFLISVGALWNYGHYNNLAIHATDSAERASALGLGLTGGLAQGWFGILAFPLAFVVGIGGLVAGFRPPRTWLSPVLVFLTTAFTALLPLLMFFYEATFASVLIRVFVYGLCVIPLALSMSNAHPKGNGPEGGMSAAIAWVSTVGACELLLRNYAWESAISAINSETASGRTALIKGNIEILGNQNSISWFIFVMAAIPIAVCSFRTGPTPTDEEILAGDASPSPWRSLAASLAFAVWLLWAFALNSLNPETLLR